MATATVPGELLTAQQRGLLLLVSIATLFEGFDTLLLSLALPYLGREFGVGAEATGGVVGAINLGTVLAFVPVRLADRFGRRPLFLTAIAGYTLATVASALASSLAVFVALQLLARMFMVTEIGIGYVILSEEMPAALRGRANAFMIAFAGLGGIAASLAFPLVVRSPLGWRGLYLLGGALLPLLPLYWLRIRETQRFAALRASGAATSLWRELVDTRVVFSRPYRRATLVASALWLSVNVWTGATVFWFTFYAVSERGWAPEQVSRVLMIASAIGLLAYAAVGAAMDLVGRRFAGAVALALGAAATLVCFTAHSFWPVALGYGGIMLMQTVWPVVGTIASEIFPTRVRATAAAVSHNLIGRVGMSLSGFAIGWLSVGVAGSVGNAVALLALAPLAAIPVVLLAVPETRGRSLEEIAAA